MDSGTLKLLLVQDRLGDTNLVPELLRELSEVHLELQHNLPVNSALEKLSKQKFDAVLFDIGQAQNIALESLTNILGAASTVPVIVISSSDDEQTGLKAISLGAQDFLYKNQYDSRKLARAIRYSILRKGNHDSISNTPSIIFSDNIKMEPTFELTAIGIAHVSLSKRIVRANKKLCEILGYSKEDLIHLPVEQLIVNESSEDENPFEQIISGKCASITFESKFLQKKGNLLWCSVTLSLVSENDNSYIIAVIEDISNRKITEENLRLSETFLSEAQELAHLGNYHLILPDGKMNWSDETFRIMGWDHDVPEPSLKEITEMVHPDDRTTFVDSIKNALRNHKRFDIEVRILYPANTEKYLHWIGEPDISKYGEVSRVYGTIMDITLRKKEEAELKYSQELLSGMFASLKEAVFLVSTSEFKIIDHNKAAEKIFGYNSSEMKGASFKLILKDNGSFEEVTKNIKDIDGSGFFESEMLLKKKDETLFSAEVYVRTIEDEGEYPLLYVSVIRDITERKVIETALRNSQQRLAAIFREIPSAVLISSFRTGEYIDVNTAFETITGYSRDEVVGSGFDKLNFFSDLTSRDEIIRKIRDDGAVRDLEVNFITKSGEEKHGLVSSVLMDVIGEFYLLTVITDITDRKKANEQVRKYVNELQINKESLEKNTRDLAELNASLKDLNNSKDKLFSIVAHDLKSPFAALLGFSEFLTNNINDLSPEEIHEFTDRIYHSLVNVFRLIENLLQWSRLHSGRIEFNPDFFSCKILVKEVIEVHKVNATNKKISIINNIEDDVYVFADRDMVETIMRNLLSNAIKFTPPEGMVILNSYDKTDSYIIEVSDTGIGIPADNIAKLFVIGETLKKEGTDKEKGTGLGLILCKEFVEKNGGKIWVESKLGSGSKFSFSIPKK